MLTVRIPEDLRAVIDEARGDIPRERWVRRACEEKAEREAAVMPNISGHGHEAEKAGKGSATKEALDRARQAKLNEARGKKR